MRSARLRPLAPLLAGGLLAACQFGPQRPVPDPLPEVLAWTREAAAPEVFLGLEVRENDSGSLDDLFFAPGVRVVEVAPGSPAEAAGIERGDVVLTVQGEEVLDPAGLRSRLDALGAVKLILEVQRGDSVFEVAAEARTLESARAAAEPVAVLDPTRTLARWRDAGGGAGLVALHPEGPAALAGLRPGSVVTALDGEPVRSARALVRRLDALPEGATVTLEVTLPDQSPARHELALFAPREVLLEAGVPFLASYLHDPSASRTEFTVLDLWLIWLVRYERDGEEHHWSVLRFLRWSTGVGELGGEVAQ